MNQKSNKISFNHMLYLNTMVIKNINIKIILVNENINTKTQNL
jgi:hypothetical protein